MTFVVAVLSGFQAKPFRTVHVIVIKCLLNTNITNWYVFSSPVSGGPVLTQSFPPMQVQQLLQMKKPHQAVQAAAAVQQKAGQPQQGQATVQQKVNMSAASNKNSIHTNLYAFSCNSKLVHLSCR